MKLRIFWVCSLELAPDGYYYHVFTNWFNGKTEVVFAGYSKRAINKESTSWITIKERMK